jgi:hypothetical protein
MYSAEVHSPETPTLATVTSSMLIYLASEFAPDFVPSIFKARRAVVKDSDTLSYEEAMRFWAVNRSRRSVATVFCAVLQIRALKLLD